MNLLQKLEHPNLVHYFGIKSFSPVDETGVFYVYLAEVFLIYYWIDQFFLTALIIIRNLFEEHHFKRTCKEN